MAYIVAERVELIMKIVDLATSFAERFIQRYRGTESRPVCVWITYKIPRNGIGNKYKTNLNVS